jgi:uncharacterized protein
LIAASTRPANFVIALISAAVALRAASRDVAPRVSLTISSDVEDADIVVTLCKDTEPGVDEGYILPVSFGVLRATHREGSENPIPLVPHQPVALTLALTPTAISFAVGTRVGLVVTGSSFPRLA